MTITAEPLALHSAGSRIGVCVARKACRTGVAVPGSIHAGHISSRVRLGVCSPDAVRINVTRHTGWVNGFAAMTRGTAFQIPASHLRVFSAATADADRDKPCLGVSGRLESKLVHISACGMTRRTKLFLPVARLAICRFPLS